MPWPRGRARPPASGRRPGTPNRLTVELRGVVREALREAGGADYLAGIARDRPELFLPLVRRILPRGVDVTQLEEAAFVARAAEMLGRPTMATQDAHEPRFVMGFDTCRAQSAGGGSGDPAASGVAVGGPR